MSGALGRLVLLARPRGGRFALGVGYGAVAAGSAVALIAVAAWLLATAAQHPSITVLSVAVVATRALGVTRGIARYLERLATHDAALRTLADVRGRVYERLAATEPVRRFRSGDLVARFVGDTDATQDLLVRGLAPPLSALLAGAGAVALATAVLVPGGLMLAAGLLVAGVAVPAVTALAGRAPGRDRAQARADLSTALVDALHGAPELLVHGAMPGALDRVHAADDALAAAARREATILGLGAGAATLVAGLTLWATLLLGVAAMAAGTLRTVPLAVATLTALAAFEIVAPLPAAAARLGAVRAAAGRLFDVLDTPPAVTITPAPSGIGAGLVVHGLRVRYSPDGPWVLDGLDLDLPPGRRVALVGASGTGKSTLAQVLFRFRDPDAGSVTLDGVDVTSVAPDQIRARLSGVPQDPHIFSGTVGDNLRLAAPAASDEQLRLVLARVRLTELDLTTDVGVAGSRLSGGMRQRIAVARALLTDARVLVLDEPTAHLDPDLRDTLLDDLLDAARDRAILLITHDPACLSRFDEVVALDHGRRTQLSIN